MKQDIVDRKAWMLAWPVHFLLLITLLVFAAAAHAQAKPQPQVGGNFNHTSTGFPLTGVHVTVECETCHTGGVFKGTPTACSGCHAPGRRVVAVGKPTNHIVTNSPCEVCHTNTVTFLGARFDHLGVQPNACQTCHNNSSVAPGKSAGHILTTASCDQCHRTSAWIPAGYNHAGVTAACTTCHGVNATGKPVTHLVTSAACDTCHTTTAWLPAQMDHTGIVSGCATCHNGVRATGKSRTHFPTTAPCETCHTSTITWAGALYTHGAGIAGKCSTCHGGQYAGVTTKQAASGGHIPTTASCDRCHSSTATFATWTMSHTGITTGCTNCHNGQYSGVTSKANKVGHIPTTSDCRMCHTTTGWLPAANHGGVAAGTCGTCHNGTAALGKSIGHIPVSGNACDACHSGFVSFANAVMNHGSVAASRCDSCHNGSYTTQGTQGAWATTHIGNHIPTTITGALDCKTCHLSTTTWTSVKMNHNGATTGCRTCHLNGTTYAGNMERNNLTHDGTGTDCSQSGCHRPLGSEGSTYVKWN